MTPRDEVGARDALAKRIAEADQKFGGMSIRERQTRWPGSCRGSWGALTSEECEYLATALLAPPTPLEAGTAELHSKPCVKSLLGGEMRHATGPAEGGENGE